MPVVRATPTGISAIIDARGRLLRADPARPDGRHRRPPARRPARRPCSAASATGALRLRAAAGGVAVLVGRRPADIPLRTGPNRAKGAAAHKDFFMSAISLSKDRSRRDAQQLSLHVRIGFGRSPRQGRRPDFRRRRRPVHRPRPEARVACETLVTTNRIVLAGEVRCREDVSPTIAEIEAAARETVKRIGYEQHGFHWQYAEFACHLHGQSADIAQGVDEIGQQGRGRRRPGHHVRLRLRRDPRPDAGDHPLFAPHPRAPGRGPPRRRAPLPRARCQEPGDPPPTRTAGRSAPPSWSSRPSTPRATTRPKLTRLC